MRLLPAALAAVLLALSAPATAQEAHTIATGAYLEVPITARDGQALTFDVVADYPVDVVLVRGGNASAYYAGHTQTVFAVYNNTRAQGSFDLVDASDLYLIVDNTPQPSNGAPGDTLVMATLTITVADVPADAPTSNAAPGGLWRTLMFTAPHWAVGPVGFGGVALWLAAFAVWAAWGLHFDRSKLLVLGSGVAALAFLWALLPHPGMVSQVGLPMLIGAGAGYLGAQGGRTLPAALRLAFLGAFLGAFVGLAAGHLVRGLWADNGMLVLGGERFLDALFTIPATAVFTAALLKVIPAFVEALEDDEQPVPEASTPLGPTFTVTCLRCATAITVNRSMKRYRVATDRYEFACPNCHAWMEWAEPKNGAAAA